MAFTTLYSSFSDNFQQQLAKIKLLVCDVDGVFSDGRIYLGNHGEELKAFNTKDGYGVKALVNAGVSVAVITGRRSEIVTQRMQSLQVSHIIQGEENKQAALSQLIQTLGLEAENVASVGDDVPDTGMFAVSNIKIAVADAHPLVLQQANWVTSIPGGHGAVREICDTLLQAQNRLHGIQAASI